MSQFTTLPSTQLLKLQNSEIFQNPAFLLSVPLSPTGFLSIAATIRFHFLTFFVYKAWCGLTLAKPSNFISYHIPPQAVLS